MYKYEYLNKIFNDVSNKCSQEKEFINAVEEFLDSINYLDKDSIDELESYSLLERLVVPERIITFRVCWIDDNGKVQVNRGYRVEFNSAIGPYKGGLRFDESVNLSILKFLGFEQTFKNSLTGLPMGGGKGGSDFSPKGKSDNEIMRFCQAFMAELYRHIGENRDVPAGDLGVGAREIGYLYGYYKKIVNESSASITGKGLSFGGSLVRGEATGYGLLYFVSCMLDRYFNTDLKNKRIIVSGLGKVGLMAIRKAKELGAIVVGTSNTKGFIYDYNGLDIDYICELISNKGNVIKCYKDKYKDTISSINPKELWNNKCDIALPCATQNEIDLESAKELVKNGCYIVAEGANMPTTLDAIKYFSKNNVIFAPGKAANAGGVAVSGLEMSQNATHISWSFEQVDSMLKDIMKNIFENCYKTALSFNEPTNLSLGANIYGFKKVKDAMISEGII